MVIYILIFDLLSSISLKSPQAVWSVSTVPARDALIIQSVSISLKGAAKDTE